MPIVAFRSDASTLGLERNDCKTAPVTNCCCCFQDYEKLAANLDGARKRLLEKVQKFASASTKIPLVEEAERHAELLHQLSKNLSRYSSQSALGGSSFEGG